MIRIATVADARFRDRAAHLLNSLENSANDYRLTIYCDDEKRFQKLANSRCDVVELPEVRQLGAKRSKLTAFATSLRQGSFLYLDADAIVLENLEEFWGGNHIKGVLIDLNTVYFIQDNRRPWPGNPSLINHSYIMTGGFYAPALLYPIFEQIRLASLDDSTWHQYILEGFLYDQHFLNAFLNMCDAPIHPLDPTAFGWEGLLKEGKVQVYRSGRQLINCSTSQILRLILFGGVQQTSDVLRSLPIEIAALIFERILSEKPTIDGALAQLYAALSDLLGERAPSSTRKDILAGLIGEIPHVASNTSYCDLADRLPYFKNPDTIKSLAFPDPPSQCRWNSLPCGGTYPDAEEYRQIRRIVREFDIRKAFGVGSSVATPLFQSLGVKTLSLEYEPQSLTEQTFVGGGALILTEYDGSRRRFSDSELLRQLPKLELAGFDLVFVDKPAGLGQRQRPNLSNQLLDYLNPRFIVYHDALRDAVDLFQDQIQNRMRLIAFLPSARGLALFALPPYGSLDMLSNSFEQNTVVCRPCANISLLDRDLGILKPGTRSRVRIALTNTAGDTLSSRYARPVYVAYHWLSGDRKAVTWDGLRTNLPADIDPGDTVEFLLQILSPEKEGDYVLQGAVVQEYVAWFDTADAEFKNELAVRVGTPNPV